MQFRIGLPTLLTLIRLLASLILLPFLLVYCLPYNFVYINALLALLFLLLGLTDFFDGYLARRLRQETIIGRLLDPIADKFLLYTTLIALLVVQKIYFFWVIIFIGREFFIMSLRLIGLEYNVRVHVSMFGKFKTCMQMFYLWYVIFNPYHTLGWSGAPWWNGIESLLLALALLITCASAVDYYQSFVNAFNKIMRSTIMRSTIMRKR